MKGKTTWLISLLLVVSLVLASCTSTPATTTATSSSTKTTTTAVTDATTSTTTTTASPEGPQYGGKITEFVYGGADPQSADICDKIWPSPPYIALVVDHLLIGDYQKYGRRGTNAFSFNIERDIPEQFLKGALVESWTVDAASITFKLKKGVIWASYGKENIMPSREVTVDDIVFSLTRFLDKHSPAMWAKNGGWVSSVTAPDKTTVVISTAKFNPNWVYDIAKGYGNDIYAPEVVKVGASNWNNLIGTGPFMVDSYVIGTALNLKRNPQYWDKAIIDGKADAVLAASIFHYGTYSIRETKEYLAKKGIPVRIQEN